MRSSARVATPHAIAEVVGTVFTLSVVEASRTTLSVEEGEVRFLGNLGVQSQGVTAATGPFEVTTGHGRPRSLATRPASPAALDRAVPVEEAPVDRPAPVPRSIPAPRDSNGGQDLPHQVPRGEPAPD